MSNKLLKARLTVMFKVILLARVHPFFFGGGKSAMMQFISSSTRFTIATRDLLLF